MKESKKDNENKKPDNLKRNKMHEQIYPYYQFLFSCEYYFFHKFFPSF